MIQLVLYFEGEGNMEQNSFIELKEHMYKTTIVVIVLMALLTVFHVICPSLVSGSVQTLKTFTINILLLISVFILSLEAPYLAIIILIKELNIKKKNRLIELFINDAIGFTMKTHLESISYTKYFSVVFIVCYLFR